ncbi:MAG: flagellar motor protein MotB [Zoogloeaceae bacterium]|nr:flagellar motor protein MotB [Rhodocyclaceae bacterium]MCP5234391.1 flagellar motor protein MotB [Zoogloeaceae bacterium]
MSDDTQQPIVVKRIKKGGGGAHGGAWKIAYADFVTAMMAFFLLMWLLGSTAQGDLEGISDFFNSPLKVAMQGGSGSGDSTSIIKGGGDDLTRSVGQVKRGEVESRADDREQSGLAQKSREESPMGEEERRQLERQERARLIDLKGQIEALVEASPSLREVRNQLLMELTTEGLRIQILDEKNRPMFDSASSVLKPYTKELLQVIGHSLNAVPNRISLTGHTDATRYVGGETGFSNWELSSDRANASRRELVAGGLDPEKIIRVVGLADTQPFLEDDPTAAQNRRIAIVVLTRSLAEASNELEVRDGSELGADAVDRQVRAATESHEPATESPRSREPRRSFRERFEAIRRQ